MLYRSVVEGKEEEEWCLLPAACWIVVQRYVVSVIVEALVTHRVHRRYIFLHLSAKKKEVGRRADHPHAHLRNLR